MRKPIHNRPTKTQIPIRKVIINEKSSNTFHCDMCKNHLVQYNYFNWCIYICRHVNSQHMSNVQNGLWFYIIYNIHIYIYAHVDSGCLHNTYLYRVRLATVDPTGLGTSSSGTVASMPWATLDPWNADGAEAAARPSRIYFNDPM